MPCAYGIYTSHSRLKHLLDTHNQQNLGLLEKIYVGMTLQNLSPEISQYREDFHHI